MSVMHAPVSHRPLRLSGAVVSCLKAAEEAMAAQRWPDAIERLAAMAVVDIQQHAQEFFAGAREAGMVGDWYARCFAGAGIERARPSARGRVTKRLLYVTPSITDGQAASQRLMQMARLHDRARFDARVLVTEEFTRRTPACEFLRWPAQPSVLGGAGLMEALRAAGVEPTLAEPQGSYLDGARAAIDMARRMEPDIAVFVASPACPISAAMAWARVAPVQINQNVAVPLIIEGIDSVIYHNGACAHIDESELMRRNMGIIRVAGNGTDLESAARAVAVDRDTLGVPRDAILLVSAGNRLPTRVTAGTFAADLAAFMRSRPNVWWLAIGPGEFSDVRRALGAMSARAVFAGVQTDIRGWLKAADLYVNEYPEGGANTVLESMACVVPVVAMRAGVRHTESIGAELAGEGMSDVAAYWTRVAAWCDDAGERKKNALAQGERVRARFGYGAICRAYERGYESLMV